MVYNKLMKVCIAISIIAIVASGIVFATTPIDEKELKVYDTTMVVLKKIQLYSWPLAIVAIVYGMYQFYVVGSEAFEYKVNGQKLIMGVCVFMAFVQCLPLIFAFITIGL